MNAPELTEFNEGGTHEQNPLGGIPQGKGPNGLPNSVEEGETKLTIGGIKYVFSNRFPVTKKFAEALSIPSYTIGKSFAEASSQIVKRFKDRVDNASISTQTAFLDRLAQAQETAKLEQAAKDAGMSVESYLQAQIEQEAAAAEAQLEQQAAEQLPAEGEQFAGGGAMVASGIGSGLDIAGAVMGDLAKTGPVREEMSVGGSAAKYAAMGAAAGSIVPGVGTAIGAGVGAIGGAALAAISNNKIAGEKQDEMLKNQGQRVLNDGYKAYGGKLNIFRSGGDPEEDEGVVLQSGPVARRTLPGVQEIPLTAFSDNLEAFDPSVLKVTSNNATEALKTMTNEGTTEGATEGRWAGAAGLAMGLAPFVGNMIEGNNLELDDPTRYQRVGKTYTPQFADERRLLNIVDESYAGAPEAIANATAGDVGAYRANLLGSNIGKAKARGEAYNQINEINRQEQQLLNQDSALAQKEEVDMYNKELIDAKQDKAAYDAAKAAYRKSMYEGLGKLGETLFQTSQMEGMSPYDIFGKRKAEDK